MDADYMMRKIADALDNGDVVNISVTSARGRTYIDEYAVERDKITHRGEYWERHGRRPCGGEGIRLTIAYLNYVVVPARWKTWEYRVYARWAQQWPVAIRLKTNSYPRERNITDEMTSWLDEQLIQYSILNEPDFHYAPPREGAPGYIGFNNEADAFAFKMRFG